MSWCDLTLSSGGRTGKSPWSWDGYFEGAISHLALYSEALDMFAIDCM